jgi:hypothetical protein
VVKSGASGTGILMRQMELCTDLTTEMGMTSSGRVQVDDDRVDHMLSLVAWNCG